MRATPWPTPGMAMTEVSNSDADPVVPKVTVAPGATPRTAPLSAWMLLSTVPLAPSTSTPTLIGTAAREVQRTSISMLPRLATPVIRAACVAGLPSKNCGSASVGSSALATGRMPSPRVESDTGGLTASSSSITLQRTFGAVATTRADPCDTFPIAMIADSR